MTLAEEGSRNPPARTIVYLLKVRKHGSSERLKSELPKGVPAPTASFRRRAWLQFQKAINPLAAPKPLRLGRR
jgi:hypothetical protein